jgi:diguanylate cyclase (GGDEF)-like protein
MMVLVVLHQEWNNKVKETEERLTREAGAVSLLLKASLSDARKIAEIARDEIDREFDSGTVSEERIHKILERVKSTYEIYTSPASLDLLIYLDRLGEMRANSGSYPLNPIDFSDRLYFQNLRNTPTREFSIGPNIVARTTGKPIFHFAVPLKLRDTLFSGVVSVQIDIRELGNSLEDGIDVTSVRIYSGTAANHDPSFCYPLPVTNTLPEEKLFSGFVDKMSELSSTKGADYVPSRSGDQFGGYFAGYHYDPEFGVMTVAVYEGRDFLRMFLKSDSAYLGFFLLTVMLITYFFLKTDLQSTGLKEAFEEAMLDHLTLIPNRRAMEMVLTRLVRDSRRNNTPLSVLFLDIDHFKGFNDQFGHPLGDIVLQSVARTIRTSLKRPFDFCCRWGGEEFLVILPETETADALLMAEKIRNSISRIHLAHGKDGDIRISVSIGLSCTMMNSRWDCVELVEKADIAMINAKKKGRNCVVIYRGSDAYCEPEPSQTEASQQMPESSQLNTSPGNVERNEEE